MARSMMRVAVLIAVLAAFGVLTGATAQAAGSTPRPAMQAKSGAAKTQTVYVCPKGCEASSLKPGKCPGCGAKLEKVTAAKGYVCERCNVASSKAGKCPKCGKQTTAGTYIYACPKCKMTSTTPGKCPHCKVQMETRILHPTK